MHISLILISLNKGWTSGLLFDPESRRSAVIFQKLFIVLTHTLSVNRFYPTLVKHTHTYTHSQNTRDTNWRRDNEYQSEIRWSSKLRSLFSLHLQFPSNPQSTSKPWSSDSSNHNLLKMSLSSEDGSMQKSIKGFNVVGLLWLPGLLSVIHQITVSHSLLLVSVRLKTGREH